MFQANLYFLQVIISVHSAQIQIRFPIHADLDRFVEENEAARAFRRRDGARGSEFKRLEGLDLGSFKCFEFFKMGQKRKSNGIGKKLLVMSLSRLEQEKKTQ